MIINESEIAELAADSSKTDTVITNWFISIARQPAQHTADKKPQAWHKRLSKLTSFALSFLAAMLVASPTHSAFADPAATPLPFSVSNTTAGAC